MLSSRHLFILAPLSLAHPAWAADPLELESSVISASALASQEQQMTSPVAVLEEQALVMRREATLGETLENLPGVRSSSFGAGAGRPIIRGLDGARVKVLNNGVDGLDASTMSPDHAVTSEPLLAERVEVLKGPATLLYGGGAIGGVVNVVDGRIPTRVPEKGYEGDFELRANSAANEGSGVFGVTAGTGPSAVRVEGVKRQADDYEIPGSPAKQDGSFNDTDTFNVGASYVGERGFIGLAYGEQNNTYGLLAHEHADCHTHGTAWHCGGHGGGHAHDEHEGTPYIVMQQKRWDLRGELEDPLPGLERGKFSFAHSDYDHKEMEGDEVGTRFTSDASEARLELTHAPVLGWRGVFGGQLLRRDFAALGEEAYVPQTLTRNRGLFLLEEYTAGDLRYEVGLRHEWQDIDADGAQSSSHSGNSVSAGVVWSFAPDYSLGLSLSRAQRLPSAEELYARGPHAATRTVELGNPDLDAETSNNVDLTLRKYAGDTTFSLSLFHNSVDDFIHAADSGLDIGGGYRQVEYRQQDARLYGFEGEVRFQIGDDSGLGFFADHVRGKLRGDGGGDLPRIPADRFGVRLDHDFSHALSGELELARVQRQDQVAAYESETAGYNLLGASLGYEGALGQSEYLVYLKGSNLLDAKARNHSSFIKDDVLLTGRNFTLGVRVSF
jgi:iron complex outermembrane receptor protein